MSEKTLGSKLDKMTKAQLKAHYLELHRLWTAAERKLATSQVELERSIPETDVRGLMLSMYYHGLDDAPPLTDVYIEIEQAQKRVDNALMAYRESPTRQD